MNTKIKYKYDLEFADGTKQSYKDCVETLPVVGAVTFYSKEVRHIFPLYNLKSILITKQ